MLPIMPGNFGAAANSQRQSFENWITQAYNKRIETRLQAARTELLLVIQDLSDLGPAWTGASAGRPDRAVMKTMPRNHPAFGMTIGNVITGGDSGWQLVESARRKGVSVVFSIINPMWDYYLKFVEYGVAPHATHAGGFVKQAWQRHKERR